ncbi:MAG TPA: biotin/lipoyl-binding protein [Chthoniobacterales bacterium]|nr:biotin/lipoyl-binding protein [Chthoniobacterales bacterium]
MEILLLGIYTFFAWLVFFKFKWLPWNIVSQVITITIPIIGLTLTILLLNIVAPSTSDVRVVNYVVQVIPQVSGRVTEVPVQANRPVKKGDLLFKIDPAPFEDAVKTAEAKALEAKARLIDASDKEKELQELQTIADSRITSVEANLGLANQRVAQYRELASKGAGRIFDVEQADTNKIALESDLDSAKARRADIGYQLSARDENGELVQIAIARANLAAAEAALSNARWQLAQTTMIAPADGTVINLQLRPGQYVNNMPFKPALLLVENEQMLLALYKQNELRKVKPGQEAEVALRTYPGKVIKCKVDSIVWAQGQGQLPWTGNIPESGAAPNPEGRFAVRLTTDGKDKDLFLAAGAHGQGAIYSDSGAMLHIIRKVILRVGSKTDWLILKLH